MSLLSEFEEEKKQIEEYQQRRQEKKGAYTQLLAQLKEDFGFKSLEEAKAKLAEMKPVLKKKRLKCEQLLRELKVIVSEHRKQIEDDR